MKNNKAIELNPNCLQAYNNRGNSYSYLKQYDKAIENYTKAIELNPNDSQIYNNRGCSYWGLNQYDKAIENYNKAIELDANDSYAYTNRGNSYSNLKQYDKLTGEELELAREQYKDQYPDVTTIEFYKKCFDIPLFDVSGEKEVDQFTMKMGYYPYP